MKGRRVRIVTLVLLLAAIAAIPASTQVLFRSGGADDDSVNVGMLVLVNRMELTLEQMEEISGVLEGILAEREALELRRAEFEEDMIAFDGTAEELDEILEAFQAETQEQIELARSEAEEAIDRIKEILTAKQGELLDEIFPGFLGGTPGVGRLAERQEAEDATGLRGQLLERIQGRLENHPQMLERLEQRVARAMPNAAFRGALRGRAGDGSQLQAGTALMSPGGMQWKADWIEQLVNVLELKMQAIE